MKLWRIANKAYTSLDGRGGLFVAGRWHSVGRPIVYTAEHAALAALEVLVNMDMTVAELTGYVLLEIDAPDELKVTELDIDPADTAACREAGDAWLESDETALCKVASVVVPQSFNYLINPVHADAGKLSITAEQPFRFDGRLFDLRKG
jgi:RES domain-containing protein